MQTSLLLILHVSQGLMDMSEVVWQERRMVRLAGADIQVSGGSGGRQMVVQLYTVHGHHSLLRSQSAGEIILR